MNGYAQSNNGPQIKLNNFPGFLSKINYLFISIVCVVSKFCSFILSIYSYFFHSYI